MSNLVHLIIYTIVLDRSKHCFGQPLSHLSCCPVASRIQTDPPPSSPPISVRVARASLFWSSRAVLFRLVLLVSGSAGVALSTGKPWDQEEVLVRCSSCALPGWSRKEAEERKSLYLIPESILQRVDVVLKAERGLRPEAPLVCSHLRVHIGRTYHSRTDRTLKVKTWPREPGSLT